jgi:hypothetical protein
MARRDRRRERAASKRALTPAPPITPTVVERVPVGRDIAPPDMMRWVPNTFSEVGWPQVVAIQLQAQRGQTMQMVDFSREMLRLDAHILSCYGTRIDAVAGAQYSIKPPSEVEPARKAMADLAASDCAKAMQGLNWEKLAKHLLDAIFTGYSVAEIIWEARGGMVWPSGLIMHHPRRFQFAFDFSLYVYDQGFAKREGVANPSNGALGPPLKRDKYIVHMPPSIPDYPTRAGLFNGLIKPYWIKSWCLKFWLSGAEQAGNPKLVGTVTQNADGNGVANLSAAINTLSADAQVVLREGLDLKFLDGASNVGPVWQDLVATQDAAISKLVLGSTLNVEIGESGGNRAASESQDATTIVPRLESDQRQLWKTVETCLFEPFLRFNLGRYGGVMPPIPVGASEIVRQQAEIDELIVSHGACSWDELRTSRGLEPWGSSAGGDARIPPTDATRAETFTQYSAPTTPSAAPADDTAVADAAPNGAQLSSLQDFLAAVADGTLAPDAASLVIGKTFSAFFTPDEVKRMVNAQAGLPPPPSAEPSALPGSPSPLGGAGSVDPLRLTASMPWARAMKLATR